MPPDRVGHVLLVGAGPGAADLLTIRAARALADADAVLVDALVSDEVRALIGPAAKIFDVGKRGRGPSTPQAFINALMARLALAGDVVVRLKGGDPSIFGRSGEERAFLEARGVRVEVIPGVTSASAAAAQFGISLTARGGARRVLFATGRTADDAPQDWRDAAARDTTVCLYMAGADISAIARDLIAAGRPADTPAFAAIDVERPTSRLLVSTLSRLGDELARDAPRGLAGAPVLIIIGEECADPGEGRGAAKRACPLGAGAP